MLSDALKRAAVRWGVGRYLYEMKAPWVALEAAGNSYRIPEAERKKLDQVHEDFCNSAGWGLRAGRVAYSFANQVVKHFVTSAAEAIDLKERNAGMIAQMPVGMRSISLRPLIGSAPKVLRLRNNARSNRCREAILLYFFFRNWRHVAMQMRRKMACAIRQTRSCELFESTI